MDKKCHHLLNFILLNIIDYSNLAVATVLNETDILGME